MTPELIVGIVSAIIGVGFVKVWLYKVFKYKMDEGLVLKFFEDHDSNFGYSASEIADAADLSESRVIQVCSKSSAFKQDAKHSDKWALAK